MINIDKFKVGDLIVGKINKEVKRIKYITPNYIVVENCKNGNPSFIIKNWLELYSKYEKHKWTDWKKSFIYFTDPFDPFARSIKIAYEFRDNGKRVQVRSGALSATASCNEEEDIFNLGVGVSIAIKRLIIKWLSYRLEAELH